MLRIWRAFSRIFALCPHPLLERSLEIELLTGVEFLGEASICKDHGDTGDGTEVIEQLTVAVRHNVIVSGLTTTVGTGEEFLLRIKLRLRQKGFVSDSEISNFRLR